MRLDGVRVLDLSRLLPGGYCTQLLQLEGARITKIESPEGDPLRRLPGGEAYFEALHHGKTLLTLDLRSEAGRRALRRQVVDADVHVEGFRPGVMERMELSYPALAALNPALVYCAVTGYGSSGPTARRARHGGLPGLSLTGEMPCYHVSAASDGFLTVAALEPDFWAGFCRAIAREDLIQRQFDPTAISTIEAVLSKASRAEWMARFGDLDVCVEPVL